MDEALQLVIEMNEWTWKRFKADLQGMTPEEIDWQPLPQANTINAILKHLWDGKPRRIAVDEADIDPLVGMSLLYGYELIVQAIQGGTVIIQPLPQR